MKVQKHRRRKFWLDIHSILLERTITKIIKRNLPEQKKTQTTVSGVESTVKTDAKKTKSRKIVSGSLFQTERRARKKWTINASDEINPKNRHCLPGLDGKYGRWDD